MASLVLDESLYKMSHDIQVLRIYTLIKQSLEILADSRLAMLLQNNHTELLTAQMWRDRQLLDQDQSKKDQYLSNFLL